MRSGKSYLGAHRPTWQNEPVESTSPRCSSEEENFAHTVLSCPPRAWAKTCFLPGVPSLDQESPIWSTPSLVVGLSKFIKATTTGFPDNMPPMGTGSPTLEIAQPPPLQINQHLSTLSLRLGVRRFEPFFHTVCSLRARDAK